MKRDYIDNETFDLTDFYSSYVRTNPLLQTQRSKKLRPTKIIWEPRNI